MNVKELGLELFVVCVLGNFLGVFYRFFLGKNLGKYFIVVLFVFIKWCGII